MTQLVACTPFGGNTSWPPWRYLKPAPTAVTVVDLRTGQQLSRTWEDVQGLQFAYTDSADPRTELLALPPRELSTLLGGLREPAILGPRILSIGPGEISKADVGFAWFLNPIDSVLPGRVEFRGSDSLQLVIFLKDSGLRVVDFVLRGTSWNLLSCILGTADKRSPVQFRVSDRLLHHIVVVAGYRAPDRWLPSINSGYGLWLGCDILQGDPYWKFIRADIYEIR